MFAPTQGRGFKTGMTNFLGRQLPLPCNFFIYYFDWLKKAQPNQSLSESINQVTTVFALLTFHKKWRLIMKLISRGRKQDEQLHQFLGHLVHRPVDKSLELNFLRWELKMQATLNRDKEKICNCSRHFRTITRPWMHTALLCESNSTLSCPPKVFVWTSHFSPSINYLEQNLQLQFSL